MRTADVANDVLSITSNSAIKVRKMIRPRLCFLTNRVFMSFPDGIILSKLPEAHIVLR